MTANCPFCKSSRTTTLESKIISNGTRRRRHKCYDCEERWTARDESPPRGPQQRLNPPPLTEEEVVLILTSQASSTKLRTELGRSRTAILAVRRGDYHRHVRPDIPRWTWLQRNTDGPMCSQCVHCPKGVCTIQIPEAAKEGEWFAAKCAAFFDGTDPEAIAC